MITATCTIDLWHSWSGEVVLQGWNLVWEELGCRFGIHSERLGNCLNRDGSQIAYVISNGSFEFRQNGVQLLLILGGAMGSVKETHAALEARGHCNIRHNIVPLHARMRDTVFTVPDTGRSSAGCGALQHLSALRRTWTMVGAE
jgi:hypothetical protein